MARSNEYPVWLIIACSMLLFAGRSNAATTQLDFSGVFNTNVVRNSSNNPCVFTFSSTGGVMGTSWSVQCYVSSSRAAADSRPPERGLPDDGLFTANSVHPRVQLAAFNANHANAWTTSVTGTTRFPALPAGQYVTLDIFASAGGVSPSHPATMRVKLNYSDSSSTTSDLLTVPNWFGGVPGAESYYLRADMDFFLRYHFQKGSPETDEYLPTGVTAIFGFPVQTNPTKTLNSIDIILTALPSGAIFAFFGATATSTATPVPTLSAWAQIMLMSALLMLAAAGWHRRRRQGI